MTGRSISKQVPIPLVPWHCSFHTAPGKKLYFRNTSSSAGSPTVFIITPLAFVSAMIYPDWAVCLYNLRHSTSATSLNSPSSSCNRCNASDSRMSMSGRPWGESLKRSMHRFHESRMTSSGSSTITWERSESRRFICFSCARARFSVTIF